MSKALIWDFDGTLAYREGGMFGASILEVMEKQVPGMAVTVDRIRPYLQAGFPWHTPEQPHLEIESADQWWEQLYPVFEKVLLGIGLDSARARSMAKDVRSIYTDPERWRLFDDAIPTLELLSFQDWHHVILSNHVPELHEIARHLGLERWIDKVFNSAEIGYEKPHPKAFQVVLDYLSGSRAIWMVGDSLGADIEGARSVGVPAILVRRYREQAEYYCDDLSQLPGALRQAVGGTDQ
jgi:putative hydrolase of the HAD superfamily